MAPLAFRRPNMSPLEQALEGGNMEVWNLLKDHIEMTVELKLEQLYNMITTVYRYREEPHTEFKELLSSLPLESVTLFNCLQIEYQCKQPMYTLTLQCPRIQCNTKLLRLLQKLTQVKPFRMIAMGDIPMTSTLLQVRYTCKLT